MTDMPVSRRRQRGVSIVMLTFLIAFVLVPMIGLAIDGAILYWMKAKLSAAVDSTALATARSLNVGLTVQDQIDQAKLVGARYFAANFPAGLMGSSVAAGDPTISVVQSSTHVRTATISASVIVPTYFMRVLNFNSATIRADGQASRRDANIVLVLDRSYSMSGGACTAMIASAQNFVSKFVEGRDQLGLITFSSGAKVDVAPTVNFKSASPNLNAVLGTLICDGITSTAQALTLAQNTIKTQINQPGALNVILFFTDGQPNGVVATFPKKTLADTRYDWQNTGTQVPNTPASSCGSTPLIGGIGDLVWPEQVNLASTGNTAVVMDSGAYPINTSSNFAAISAPGCAFNGNALKGRLDVAYIPTADSWGNSTVNGVIPSATLDTFPTGSAYAGQIRPDMPRTVRYASINAADSRGLAIRNDTTYGIVTYVIYLQGNEPMAPLTNFMERLANDPRASNYDPDPAKGHGQYILAADKSALASAFNAVASQILRLSQ